MKYLISTLLTVIFFCNVVAAYASAGDTTVVVTSPVLNADNSTNYDTLIVLPTGKTYRKIFLVYTLNSHPCSASATYCHQWDYIGNVTLKTPHGDTVELERIITPFATSGWTRFPNPPAWSEDYVFDVTDFAPFLSDSVTINSALGVGSPGYGIQTKFVFVEGIPDRNTVGIKRVYAHGGTYGRASNPIDNNFPVMSETAPAGTVSAAFRFILTGHGSDTFGCCEFAEHYYNLYLNGDSILQQYVWRNCGFGELYPQGGSWSFNRSNWCPGASVMPYYDSLPGVTAGSNYTVKVGFEPYVVNSPSGNYDASASVVYYGGINKTLDVSVEDIIAPSTSQQHFRENPSHDIPIVHIHNAGSTPIDSVAFTYGVADSVMQSFTWAGRLAPLGDTIINLPASSSMQYMSATSQSGTFPFMVAVTAVNGTADVDQTNDTMRSQFVVAPDWPDTILVKMLTSNLGADGMSLDVSPADAGWDIVDLNGDTIFSRSNTNYSTLYVDTVIMPRNGYYQFFVSTPAFCAGLHWWLFDNSVSGYAPGYLQVKKTTGANIPMHGYTYATGTSPAALKNLGEHDDFGCGYSQYFYVSSSVHTVGVGVAQNTPEVSVYPNPANEEINVSFDNWDPAGTTIALVNILGQTVYAHSVSANYLSINSASFAPGVYAVNCISASGVRTLGKVVVEH